MAERVEILKVEVDNQQAGEELTKIVKELARVQREQAMLNKELMLGNKLNDEQKKAYADNVKEIDRLKGAQKTATKEIITGIKNQKGSVMDLRESLKQLVDQRNKISLDTKEGQQAVRDLNKQIAGLNDEISAVERGGGDFRRNVGNYASAFDGLGANVTSVIGALEGVNVAALFTKASLLAIPFVAIATIIALFVSRLMESEKFTNALSRGFALLKDVAKPALDIINDALNATIEAFEFGLSALEAFVASFKSASKEQQEATKGTITSYLELEKAQQALLKRQREFQIENKKLIKDEEALKNIRDDERKTIDERIEANEKLAKIEQERLAKGIALQEEAIRLIQSEIDLKGGESLVGSEMLNKLTDARVALEELVEESIGRQNEAITNQVQLERELFEVQQELAQKRAEVALAEAETKKEEFKARQKLLNTELKNEENAIKQRSLNAEQQAEFLLLIERDYLQKQKDLREEFGLKPISQVLFGTKEQLEEDFEEFKKNSEKINEDVKKGIDERLKAAKKETEAKKAQADRQRKIDEETEQAKVDLALNTLGITSSLLEQGTAEYKGVKIAETVISTAAGISKAFADPKLVFPADVIQASVVAATGAVNIATIAAAAGGGEFVTKGETLLLVGDNPGGQERVIVEPIGGRGTTRTAGTNLDVISNSRQESSSIDAANMIQAALMNMPPPVVTVREFNTVARRVQVKEQTANL